MVGALADWFAVTALFKKVHIPFISRHTEIIPRNKEKIANNLASFVHEKFFNTEALTLLIRKNNPAEKLYQWLNVEKNADLLSQKLNKVFLSLLNVIDDTIIQNFIIKAFHHALSKVDLSRGAGSLLDSLTKDKRHQALLDEAITYIARKLEQEDTQIFMSEGIVRWLQTEHPTKEKVLPTQWIGKNGAKLAVDALSRILSDVAANPKHKIRVDFDEMTQRAILRLKTDESFKLKAEEIKAYIKDDEKLNAYIKKLWQSARNKLTSDVQADDSVIAINLSASASWLGDTLKSDTQLQQSINAHIEDIVQKMAPEFTEFLVKHISDTVKNWDDKDMSRQIELNIGKDLQFIRINGTIVGGLIGLILFFLSHAHYLLSLA